MVSGGFPLRHLGLENEDPLRGQTHFSRKVCAGSQVQRPVSKRVLVRVLKTHGNNRMYRNAYEGRFIIEIG